MKRPLTWRALIQNQGDFIVLPKIHTLIRPASKSQWGICIGSRVLTLNLCNSCQLRERGTSISHLSHLRGQHLAVFSSASSMNEYIHHQWQMPNHSQLFLLCLHVQMVISKGLCHPLWPLWSQNPTACGQQWGGAARLPALNVLHKCSLRGPLTISSSEGLQWARQAWCSTKGICGMIAEFPFPLPF